MSSRPVASSQETAPRRLGSAAAAASHICLEGADSEAGTETTGGARAEARGLPAPSGAPRVTRRGSLGLCPPPAGRKTGCSQCTLFRADNLHDQSDPQFHTDVPSSTRSWVLGSLSFQCRWGSILETAGRSFWKEPSGSSPSGGRAGTRAVRGDGVSRLPADRDPREPELEPEPRPGSPQRKSHITHRRSQSPVTW